MSKRNKLSFGSLLEYIIVSGLLIWGFVFLCKQFTFEPNDVLKNSVLKEKNFETNVVEVVSPKGVKAYLFEDKTNPIVSISFVFKQAGLAYDAEGKVGISNLVASLLTEGVGDYTSQQFKERLEANAISISFGADMDDLSGSLLTVKDKENEAYRLLNLALMKPRLEWWDINRIKDEMKIALKKQKEHPARALSLEVSKEIYGMHPYSRNPVGIEADIENISKVDLQRFIRDNFSKENLIVGVAGDISKEELVVVLDKIFGDLSDVRKNKVELSKVDLSFDGRVRNIEREVAQGICNFVNKGAARLDEDFYPLYIANHIFGGSGLNSRLSMIVREDKGLAYSIYSYLSLAEKSPLIMGSFYANPQNLQKVLGIVKKEWLKMGTQGVSSKELNEAKNYLISSYNLRFASTADIANILAQMQRENLGIDFLKVRNNLVEAVSVDDVKAAAQKFFGKDNTIFVCIGEK